MMIFAFGFRLNCSSFVLFMMIMFWSVYTLAAQTSDELKRFEYNREEMGVPVRVVLFAPNEALAQKGSQAVYVLFSKLNAIMSDYDPESEIIQVCRRSGESGDFVPVSRDLHEVLAQSRRFTEMTHGAFDITVSPIVKLWRRSRMLKKLPPEDYLADAKKLVGNDRWELDARGVRVLNKGVRFDVGGIAKGYALDRALDVLKETGITRALIDAGGDVRLGDPPPGKKGWNIGFASLDSDASAAIHLELANVGIASSGDTFRFVEIDSVRYSHLIDPRSGRPLTIHRVVSIVASNATTADALASAVSVLGPEDGLLVVRSFPGTDALIFQWNGKDSQNKNETFSTPLFKPFVKQN